MFKVSPTSFQTFNDMLNFVPEDRVQYSTVHIPNVFCDGHLQIISCVYCNRQVHRDFLITLYLRKRLTTFAATFLYMLYEIHDIHFGAFV
jgi:hypothetical protein